MPAVRLSRVDPSGPTSESATDTEADDRPESTADIGADERQRIRRAFLRERIHTSVTGGTYTLVVSLEATTLTFGAAGERSLRAGPYAYIGSALGGGGFTRVGRHRELVAGERDTRHWHIDYLLGAPESTLVGDRRLPGCDAECAVAAALRKRADPVPGLGASDCDCPTHLFRPCEGGDRPVGDRRAGPRARVVLPPTTRRDVADGEADQREATSVWLGIVSSRVRC